MICRKFGLTAIVLWTCASLTYGQSGSTTLSTEDSIRLFTDSVLSLVENHSLYTEKVDWRTYRSAFTTEVLKAPRFSDALPHFITLWDTLGDDHSTIGYAGKRYGRSSRLDTASLSKSLRYAFQSRKTWTVQTKVLADQFGYIAVPSISTLDDSIATLKFAESLQDSLCRLARHSPRGWIVDLRRNLGGNMYAMLAGVHQLVAKDTFSYLLNNTGDIVSSWSVNAGAVLENKREQIVLPQRCPLINQEPMIAVLVGPLTASSGEITALAFLGQKNTILIGETTAGYMTGNEVYRLPFGGYIALAEVYETNRFKQKLTAIQPSIEVRQGDDFEHLLNDTKIKVALEWLSKMSNP